MSVRTFRQSILVFSIAFLFLPLTYVLSIQAVQKFDEKERARTILAQMRKAVFGEIKPDSLKGLSLTLDVSRSRVNGDQDTGQVSCDFLLPNIMFIRDRQVVSGNQGQFTIYKLLNGEQIWSDVQTSGGEIPVIPVGGPPKPDDQVKGLQTLRREQAYLLIRLALSPSPDFPLTFSYAGEAQASDGRADMIEVRGPNDFSARLFVEKGSSRLLMMTYPEPGARLISASSGATPVGQAPSPKDVTRAEAKYRFSEYREVGGVMMPHLMTYESGGKIRAEYKLKRFELNPNFAPDHFNPSKKRN
jgi:hypothetical protein